MEEVRIDSKFADKNGEIMIVELGGHIDQSNSYRLQKMFDNIIQSSCFKVIVDFNKLYYMSSSGWGIFVGEIKRFRENGGDIKLAAMNPEINEVYQMLEFYHILEDYVDIETAAASFKTDSGELDLVASDDVQVPAQQDDKPLETSTEEIEMFDMSKPAQPGATGSTSSEEQIDFEVGSSFGAKSMTEFIPHTLKQDVKLADLPVTEKVKRVVAQNPLLGVFGIRKVLRHEHFGFTRVGLFRLRSILKELDLNSKDKRYRFYRSC